MKIELTGQKPVVPVGTISCSGSNQSGNLIVAFIVLPLKWLFRRNDLLFHYIGGTWLLADFCQFYQFLVKTVGLCRFLESEYTRRRRLKLTFNVQQLQPIVWHRNDMIHFQLDMFWYVLYCDLSFNSWIFNERVVILVEDGRFIIGVICSKVRFLVCSSSCLFEFAGTNHFHDDCREKKPKIPEITSLTTEQNVLTDWNFLVRGICFYFILKQPIWRANWGYLLNQSRFRYQTSKECGCEKW